jgi:hypothetical protein
MINSVIELSLIEHHGWADEHAIAQTVYNGSNSMSRCGSLLFFPFRKFLLLLFTNDSGIKPVYIKHVTKLS